MDVEIPEPLRRILAETPALQRAYLVGAYEDLAKVLTRWGRTDLVGRSFGVVKLTVEPGVTFDFTVPRRDSKTSPGHKGFEIEFDPAISPRDAASRRDFTINALMCDPRTGEVLDFFGGLADLRSRTLRHTSPAFVEDPLRVVRGMQFAGRFDLKAAPETVELARSIGPHFEELARERVREEWFKWAGKSVRPSAGLTFLNQCGWIDHFPEIKNLLGTPQDPEWHPEGDVFTHTGHCLDALVQLEGWQAADDESRVVYSLAVLGHDFGKAGTTHQAERKGRMRIVSPGHETAGAPLVEKFLERIGAFAAVRDRVLPLVVNHMAHYQNITDRGVRLLSKRLEPETIEGLCLVMTADQMGRPPLPRTESRTVSGLLQKARDLQVQRSAPSPILLGRHLLEAGWTPGPDIGRALHAAYDAQLEGEFHELAGAMAWLSARGRMDLPPGSKPS
jgi:tRNA nucleotidyltransferase (CCA-adding enzyme)